MYEHTLNTINDVIVHSTLFVMIKLCVRFQIKDRTIHRLAMVRLNVFIRLLGANERIIMGD